MPEATAEAAHPAHRRIGLQWRLTLAFLGVALSAAMVLALVLLPMARAQVLADLRQRLGDIVAVGAAGLDAELLGGLSPRAALDDTEYLRARGQLQRLRDNADDLKYVYVLRADSRGAIRFLVDAEDDPADIVRPGTPYDDASPLLAASFATLDGLLVETDFYTDRWGTWLSGYAPLHAADGARVGVLGADISAATVQGYMARVRRNTLLALLGLLPVILLAGLAMGRALARPVVSLSQGARRIAGGDLDTRLAIRRRDEIGDLAGAFNRMAAALGQSHRRIEQAARKYQRIFDEAAEGIFRSTPDGRLLTANRALLDLLGYADQATALGEITDLGRQVYVHAEDRAAMLAALRTDGAVRGLEVAMRRRDGGTFWGELSLHETTDEAGSAVLEGMLLDVTERRRRHQAELAREAAEAANAAKSGFLANMSHEIRTPLNAIMGLTDLVLRGQLSEGQREHLGKVKGASVQLLGVINDILDISKIEAGRLSLDRVVFSLDTVLANLTETFAYSAHRRDIELIVHCEPDVPRGLVGDPVRLGQILVNLTGNALKFTEHGEVAVTVGRAGAAAESAPAASDGEVVLAIEVRDTGIGIAADRQAAIFDVFSQVDGDSARRRGGTGLGLPIVRQLARMMGGEVRVDSEPGVGSCFRVTVRFGLAPAQPVAVPATPPDLRGLRVLVVEDNATAREVLARQVASFQMHATVAADGEAALALLAAADPPFDLVLLDWKMPGLDGLAAARRIRDQQRTGKTPVVCMISGYTREDLLPAADRTLLDGFLQKPVNASFLFDTIVGLFGHPEAASAPERAVAVPTAAPDLGGRRVLLVEDVEINRLVAREWLEAANLRVDEVTDGAAALEQLDPARHALVLMDLQMPVLDGLEATRRLRASGVRLPVIAMTAHALKEDVERCHAAGMDDFVAKPIDPAHLFATLRKWLAPRAAPDETAPGAADSASARSQAAVSGGADDPPQRNGSPGPPAPAPDAAAPPLPDLPGIDTAAGLAHANGNAALYRRLLLRLRDDWADLPERVRADLTAGRTEEARRALHSLKGVAGNLGAARLQARAETLEARCGAGTLAAGDDDWRALTGELAAVIDGLAALSPPATAAGVEAVAVAADAGGDQAGPDEAGLDQALAALAEALDDDFEQARRLFVELRQPLSRHIGETRTEAIGAMIGAFDIDAAISAIRAAMDAAAPAS
jgi:PAS domain S-box-containing protein